MTQRGFFDMDERFKRVSDLGDPPEVMREAVDFEAFHPRVQGHRFYSRVGISGRTFVDAMRGAVQDELVAIPSLNKGFSTGRTSACMEDKQL